MTNQRTEKSPHLTATDDSGEYLTIADLAARWKTTRRAIYNQRNRGEALPRFFRRGSRQLLTTLAEVKAFEDAGMAADEAQQPQAA